MRTIKESYALIIEKAKELNYPLWKYFGSPLSDTEIKNWETQFKFKFNDELKALYTLTNGTNNDNKTLIGHLGLIPIHMFLNLNDAFEYYTNTISYTDLFTHWDTESKPGINLFPLLEDGEGNCFWVDLNKNTENYGKIYWTNTYDESPDYLYNSLTNFLHVISESYEKSIMFLDEEGFLDCDYDAFDALSMKHNSNLDFWTFDEEMN